MTQKSNKKNDLILGFIVLFFSILMLLEARGIPGGILDEQIGFIASPRGFIILIGGALLILSFILIIKTLITPFTKDSISTKKSILPWEVLISMVLLVVYVATLPIFGFFINSFILLLVTMTIYYIKEKKLSLKNRKVLMGIIFKIAVISIISLFFLQQVFVRLLGVRLPRGFMGF